MRTERSVKERAMELHSRAVVIDCHSDLLMPIADGYTRLATDQQLPDPAIRALPFDLPADSRRKLDWPFGATTCLGHYDLPKFYRGGLSAQVCAVFVDDHELHRALERCLDMVWCFHREMDDNRDRIEPVNRAADIRRLKAEGKCGAVLAIEGFEPFGNDLRLLDLLYKLGVRIAGLAHNRRSAWSDGTQHYIKTGGLTSLGKDAVRRMNDLSIVVDVGHLNTVGFWETLETTKAPVVLSHRSPRKFFPLKPEDSPLHPAYDVSQGRERLEALARNGGVFGVFFLGARDVEDVVDDIEYVVKLVGPDYVGLGSDLYGRAKAPTGLEDISRLPAITRSLVRRGYSDGDILKILGENFMRVFQDVWQG
jgi:membrane dipeptidase